MLNLLILSLLLKTVTTMPVLDQLLGCSTQFVSLDYKIQKTNSQMVAQVWNQHTHPYTLESINFNAESNLKSLKSSNSTIVTHFFNVKFILCSAFVYFADPFFLYTKQSIFNIFQSTQIIPFSTNPTFLVVVTNSTTSILMPDHTVDITSIYLFSGKHNWYMFCIPCAQKFHTIPTHESNVNLLDMWKNVHKFTDTIPLQTPLLHKWDSEIHRQECPNWDRRLKSI